MAGRAIIDHEDKVVREFLSHMAQEKTHTFPVHGGQDEVNRSAILRAKGPVGICVFADDLFANDWPDACSGPASARIVDPAKAGFVLKENAQSATGCTGLFISLREQVRPFF